jgi:pyruvate dehydrogenase E1 component alpha subunit
MIKDLVYDQNSFPGEMFQVIAEDGTVKNQELLDSLKPEQLVEFYEWMIRIRIADKKANNLQRTGKMGTYPAVYGQEACQVGPGLALEKKDWLVPTFRETGTMWCFGVPLKQTFLYWMGNEIGSCMPDGVNCFPIAITVGGHLPHATGIAWANKRQNIDSAVLCSFSDGATSEGDFHAALNFAGVLKTSNVFFCQNNGYAISTKTEIQTASKTIAQKAFSYGMKAILVDGNDVVATYLATKEALRLAREENTPVLIDAVTYRLGDHTSSDNAKLYREDSEVEAMAKKEPFIRIRKYLESQNLWDDAKQEAAEEKAKQEADDIAKKAQATKKLNPENMMTMLYKDIPPPLEEQRKEFREELKQSNSDRLEK